MPDPIYAGIIQDKGGAVHNLRAYGAVGNGTTPDTNAIIAAIAAVPEGGTLYIPPGRFRITQTIHINRAISIEGSGSASAFWVDLADPTQPGIVIGKINPVSGSVVSIAENQSYRNFGIFGRTGSCRYGLAVYHASRSRFENIHVRPGSTEHAIVIGGCLYCHFNFICSNNSTDGYPEDPAPVNQVVIPGLWNGAAILVEDLTSLASTVTTSDMPTNVCVFDCTLQAGFTTGGLAFKNQRYPGNNSVGGNNQILGTYEGFATGSSTVYGAGYGLLIDGCTGFDIHDVHLERNVNGTWIKNCGQFSIHDANCYDSDPIVETIRIDSSSGFSIRRVQAGLLRIGPECTIYDATGFTGMKDPALHARTNDSFFVAGSIPGWPRKATTGMAPFTTENLIANGDMSRWPHGFGWAGTEPTVVRTGDVPLPGDTTRRFNRYALKVSSTGAPNINNVATLTFEVPDSLRYAGQPVTIWADIKRSSGAEIGLAVYQQTPGSYTPFLARVPTTETQWVRVAGTYYPDALVGPWHVILLPTSTGPYTYHLGAIGALVGVAAPMGVGTPAPSFENGLQLTGKRIEYGTAAPTTGTWQPGDIVFNASPTPGGSVGWVCTAAPGTWKTFGAISS